MHYERHPRPAEDSRRGDEKASEAVIPVSLVLINQLPNGGGRQVLLLPNLQRVPRKGSSG